tara:strand:+ start:162 stop:479 length:318 start_codon:yes stop_codon:yes gene_type:complete
MKFHEELSLQCPSRQSFEDHLDTSDKIQEIAQGQNCTFIWKVLNEEDKTFLLEVKGPSKKDHMNRLIAVMKYLHEQDIEPALVINQKDLLKTRKKIKEAINVIDA